MDLQYEWDMLMYVVQKDYWILVLLLLLMVGCLCWVHNRLSIFIALLPIVLLVWCCFENTGHFSPYGRVIRHGVYLYSQEEYSKQIAVWIKEVDDCHGRWVSMVSCPQVSDNGTKFLWVEFAYQPSKSWYEPIYMLR